MSTKYKNACIDILKINGPLLGSEFSKFLIEKFGVSPTNARQIILRLKKQGEFSSRVFLPIPRKGGIRQNVPIRQLMKSRNQMT
ncbi:hypothetical protein [Bacillus sp. BP-3]|uniref:hypothetical protein n=1 Tax=Bacillus sp. BP-3 TaxID=3022773 RepID=UPI00232DEE7A|nr:hypothetical protein [Bacillus sp. BP-3]MDC2867786.1 hypothetical protein [Bacillus sp. BP-3]